MQMLQTVSRGDALHNHRLPWNLLIFGHPKNYCNYPQISTMWLYHGIKSPTDTDRMANSVDPDQTAPLGAVWSGSTLFAQPYLSENLGPLRYSLLGYSGPDIVLILCSSVVYTTKRFMFGLALLFVCVFLLVFGVGCGFCLWLFLDFYVYFFYSLLGLPWQQNISEDKWNEPTHGIMALFFLRKLILQMLMRSHPVGLYVLSFRRTLRLLPYFMCANSEGSGETAQMCRLVWAFAGRLCDKYHNLISWLKW